MWSCWQVGFALRSPLHVGWQKQGNVQYTRPYITGSVLWGALTARMTRDGHFTDYKAAGTFVDEGLAFSYFYLSDESDRVTAYPWHRASFEWRYMSSYSSTALEDGYVKEDGSLHETEFLCPKSRPDGATVYAVGLVFAKLPDAASWATSLQRVEFGGNRSYGWGRVALKQFARCETPESVLPGILGISLETDRPQVRLNGVAALAHIDATTGSTAACVGELEPFIGRRTNTSGAPGVDHSEAEITWPPGTQVNGAQTFDIGARGIWRPASILPAPI